MKSITEFILERINDNAIIESSTGSKEFTFDFTGLEGGEDIAKSLDQYDFVTIEGQKVKITLSPENKDSVDGFQDIIQQFYNTIRRSSQRTNNEEYAQKTLKFGDKIEEFNDYLDELNNPEEDTNDSNKEDETE